MSDAGNRDEYGEGRMGSPRNERRPSRSRSPRRSFSPRSRSPSERRDRRRSRSPRREHRGGSHDRSYSRGGYRNSDRGGGGGNGQGRRVYVGNLPYDVKWGSLKDFMRSAGEVIHADVLMNSDGRSKGCGVVEYATASEAQRAIAELSNQTMNGRMVYIREDREQDKGFGSGRGGYGGSSRGGYGGGGSSSYHDRPHQSNLGASAGQITQPQIYITNLPYSVGWQDLKDLFRNAGSVVRADVQMGYDGRSKGTGIVLYESIADAQNAFKQFQGYDWQGRMLDIREDRFVSGRGGARGGYSDRGGFSSRGGGRGGYASSREYGSTAGGYNDDARSYGEGDAGGSGGDGYNSYRAPPINVEPNPFTDNAWGNGDPSATIYVKNLPWSTSNDDLVDLFSTIGKVERAEICYEANGRSKGTGVVEFDGQDAASVAIQKFMGYSYGGRPLNLSFIRYSDVPLPTGPAAMVYQSSSANVPLPQPIFNGDSIMGGAGGDAAL